MDQLFDSSGCAALMFVGIEGLSLDHLAGRCTVSEIIGTPIGQKQIMIVHQVLTPPGEVEAWVGRKEPGRSFHDGCLADPSYKQPKEGSW